MRPIPCIFFHFFATICLPFIMGNSDVQAENKQEKTETSALQIKEPTTAEEIIRAMDRNMVFVSRRVTSTMRIFKRGRIRSKVIKSYSKGQDTSYSEFLSPARDKGVKYLKIKNNLWMYLPSAEKVVKISGHMLRQSMMGSDFSYEDMLESKSMRDHYHAQLLKPETIRGMKSYIIELKQKKPGQTYPKQKYWIHKTNFVPLRSEMYAASGRLLKVMTFHNIKEYKGRFYPTKTRLENKLMKGTWTEVVMNDIAFKIELPSQIFSLRNLQRE